MTPFAHLPRERTWLLPALDAVQRAEGHVSAEALAAIASHLRVPLSEVWGVATHYPELRLRPPGRRLVRVCTGLSCRVNGSLALLGEAERGLGISAGATAAGGEATLEEMDCAFACGVAPVVEVDHRRIGRATVAGLASRLESPKAAVPSPACAPACPAPWPVSAATPRRRHAELAQEAAARAPRLALAVGLGSSGAAAGAEETYEGLREEVRRRGLDVALIRAGDSGASWAAPVVEVLRPGGPRLAAGRVSPERVGELIEAARAGRPLGDLALDPAWLAGQRRILLDRCGVVDPGDIASAIRAGAYAALAAALEAGDPARVIEEVRAAGLQGRGGAYFQTAVKWAACREAAGGPKYVVVNGEEGEPGIFKDRHLMEGDPHQLLEGLLLAAYAVGAPRAVLYVHGEADLAAERLATALDQARQWGLLGHGILGSTFSLEVEIRRGLGGFVLGEETALLESIEGRRAMPRTRPPFPVEAGLWGRPTVINNVETLSAVPHIVARGGAWFADLGRGHGTKLFGLSGHLRRPGVVEVEAGVTLRQLLEGLGGGAPDGRALRAAVVGGPSGVVVPARLFDEPMLPRGAVNPGTGGVVALDATASVRDAVRTLLGFNARESCGKCTPCREGTARLLAMLDGPMDGGRARSLAEVVQVASLCGLGQAAPLALLSGLAEFGEEFGG